MVALGEVGREEAHWSTNLVEQVSPNLVRDRVLKNKVKAKAGRSRSSLHRYTHTPWLQYSHLHTDAQEKAKQRVRAKTATQLGKKKGGKLQTSRISLKHLTTRSKGK